jgi:hypothetical protein
VGWVVVEDEGDRGTGAADYLGTGVDLSALGEEVTLRLGQELRVVLAAVGGGAIQIGREIARRGIRHLETVAINCDSKVHAFEEYDRRIYLGPDSGADVDTGGSAVVGGLLARAAEPALQKVFQGASFVILLGSLGGGAGSGAFPYVLEVASRNAGVVSAFVVKPFHCEGQRRSLADRAIGRLKLIEPFVEKQERGTGTLRVLDNELLIPEFGKSAFTRVSHHWAAVVENHIEQSILAPAEALLATVSLAPSRLTLPVATAPATSSSPGLGLLPPPVPPLLEPPPPLPAASASVPQAELTFEVLPPLGPSLPTGREG